MAITPEDAKAVADLRLEMVMNMQAGRPPEAGIDKERLKDILAKVRKTRSIGAASGKKAKASEVIPLDLSEFMKKK